MAINNVKKTLVIGSGPIVIGQAAEFDYSGVQACETLKEEGIEVILINSNPATIMTDTTVADRIYIEPITTVMIEKIIKKEKPDSILVAMGGQTALNMAIDLEENNVLQNNNIKVLGTSIESIKRGEDRELFIKAMKKINEPTIESMSVDTLEKGLKFAAKIGYPVIVRPAYTLGGAGGGIASNTKELENILLKGLALSRVGQVLVEKSILGWKEVEYEVMRDKDGNKICVCNMENVDPVGVHTGDSIVVAPSQTLSDKDYQMLRTSALNIIEEIGIIGGCNVQFALHPNSFEYALIEINPRVSRSSALASKATGYPIARVATKLSLGYTLDEIKNDVTGKTYACFEPALDYIVVKIPKWPFDKFVKADRELGTKMMATGEIMAIGNNFESAFLKGVRSLEIDQYGLEHKVSKNTSLEDLKKKVVKPSDERIFHLAEMLRRGYTKTKLQQLTGMDPFFMEKLQWIVKQEELLKSMNLSDLTEKNLRNWKKKGFSDKAIGKFLKVSEEDITIKRKSFKVEPVYKMVDTCAGEFEASSSYFYSVYDEYDEVKVTNKNKVIVIGSGPIRIGQGIEFDYCTVHAVKALQNLGIEAIVINNNPETVSTDFSTADKLYFEPLVFEDVMNVIEKEKPIGVILQFGGQTAIKLANSLEKNGVKIIGTSAQMIDTAEDREKFEEILEQLNIRRPKGRAVWNISDGADEARKVGYPVLVRPSYVLGGQGMEICYEEKNLVSYLEDSFERDGTTPVLVDKYLNGVEIEIDAICDGDEILIPGVMEHLERAGIHSGDSITLYPSQNLHEGTEEKILEISKKLANKLNVIGMINIQFIAFQEEIYVIEVNPRSSRTVPYISKVSGVPMIEIATKIIMGEKLKNLEYGINLYKKPNVVCVKVPVFSIEKLNGVEVSLGPEMKSTGEVLGIGNNLKEALYKGLVGGNRTYKLKNKKILATIKDGDKEEFLDIARRLEKQNCSIIGTTGTAKFLNSNGVRCEGINKLGGNPPTIEDELKNQHIDMLINTPTKANDDQRDGFKIRRIATEYGVEVITSLDTLTALLDIVESGIEEKNLDIFDISKLTKGKV